MIIFVDIDETICTKTDDLNYINAKPISERIEKINKLYEDGNTIIYWTARGTTTGIDWTDLTADQLQSWGAKHHDLMLGKPHYDLFIDDKNINSETFFKET